MNATRSDRSEHESSRTSPSMLLGAALRVVTCVLVAAGVAPRADAEPLFAAPFLSFDTGDGPQSVAIGDLNGDGKPDLAVASGSSTVSVLLGNGDGSFGAKADFGTGSNPVSVAIGDMNGDGTPDLAVANEGSNTISVLLGNGDGSFGAKADFGTGSNPVSVAIGDVNGDGTPDLAVANSGSNTVLVLLNRGTTTPVTVENLEAAATERGVQLRWRLSLEAQRTLWDLAVERAPAAEGPYVVCGRLVLVPATEMSFEDSPLQSGVYWYRLVLVWLDGSRTLASPVAVQFGADTPRMTVLHQPFALPGGGAIQIRYSLAGDRVPVEVGIYDVRGRMVWSSARSVRDPGEYTQTWDRRDRWGGLLSRGIYFVRLDAGGVQDSKKLALVER